MNYQFEGTIFQLWELDTKIAEASQLLRYLCKYFGIITQLLISIAFKFHTNSIKGAREEGYRFTNASQSGEISLSKNFLLRKALSCKVWLSDGT